MADNLKVTTPISTSENINRITPTKTGALPDAVLPEKVSSRNTAEQAGRNDILFELNRNSVYNKYIQMLNSTPVLKSCLEELLFSSLFQQSVGVGKLRRRDRLQELMSDLIKMEKEDMVENIEYQVKHNTKFSGPLFNFLRSLCSEIKGDEFRQMLGEFLKAYDNYFSAEETFKSILHNLNNIVTRIPKSYASGIMDLMKQLSSTLSDDRAIENNATILKNQIILKLAEYIARTNDFGEVRDEITLLLYNTSRLNTANRDNLVNTFEELLAFCRYNAGLSIEKAVVMQKLFEHALQNTSSPKNEFFDTLINLISRLPEYQSSRTEITAKDLASTLLLDNSVFNPFLHVFLPVNYHGKNMFTEIWVAPDSENDSTMSGGAFRLFLTFDIKTLGYFEAVLLVNRNTISTQIRIPPTLDVNINDIREDIKQIFASNTFTVEQLEIVKSSEQRTVFEVFPNISRRRRDINVTV